MKNKRGFTFLEIIVFAAIALVGGFIIIKIFINLSGNQATITRQEILGVGDYDGDFVIDKIDACLCLPGEAPNDGCPYGVKADKSNATLRYKSCSEDFCKKYGLAKCPT